MSENNEGRALPLTAEELSDVRHVIDVRRRGGGAGPEGAYYRDVSRLLASLDAMRAERDEWKKRAAQHGCNITEGDDDCG